jgi:hypothetical protein
MKMAKFFWMMIAALMIAPSAYAGVTCPNLCYGVAAGVTVASGSAFDGQ